MDRMKDFFRHLFIPHHTNNFKAKLLHIDMFVVYVLLFMLFNVSVRVLTHVSPQILGFATNIVIDTLVSLTNQQRANLGLSPLHYNDKLSQAAAGKANDMFANDYWAHNSPEGKTPWDFIVGAGYRYVYAGENLAKNFSDSNGVVDAWMASPSHRENIVRPEYDEVGFAVVNGKLQGEETTLVVQMFGKSQSSAVAQVAQAAELEIKKPVEVIPSTTSAIPIAEAMPSSPPSLLQIIPVGGVSKKPLFDILSLTRKFSIGLSVMIMGTLIIDGFYVWRKNIVRISGRNLAHVLFLTAITGALWLTTSLGAVL